MVNENQAAVVNNAAALSQSLSDDINPIPNPQGEAVLSDVLSTGAESMQPENPISQNLPQETAQEENQPKFDIDTLALLLNLLQKVNKDKGAKAKPIDFINILEAVLENAQEQEK